MLSQPKASESTVFRLIALTCVLLVVFMGMAQAVHVHPNNSKLPSHECSICSLAHAGILNKTTQAALPVIVRTPLKLAHVVRPQSTGVFDSFCIRPPPLD